MEKFKDKYIAFFHRIDWSIQYKDSDVLPEFCPVCRKKVFIKFYGSYKQSYLIHCETPNCMYMESRGL